VRATEFFDAQTSDFSPLFSKVKESGRAVHVVVLVACVERHLRQSSGMNSRFPMPYGGIDVKSMDGDFLRAHRWQVGGRDGRPTSRCARR